MVEQVSGLQSLVDFLKNLDFKSKFVNLDLRSLLMRGYVRSGEIVLSKELRVEVRTLLVNEWIKCKEVLGQYRDPEAGNFAFMVEYLVYALITVNGVQPVMDMHEIQEFREKHGREPTMEEQIRYVLMNVYPPFVVELLWMVAWKFKQDFEEVFMQRIVNEFSAISGEMKRGVAGA